jgi:hypothetical protein
MKSSFYPGFPIIFFLFFCSFFTRKNNRKFFPCIFTNNSTFSMFGHKFFRFFRMMTTNTMNFSVNTYTIQKFEVFNSVIKSITVFMMNDIFFCKISADKFFHYKTMFSNITSAIFIRMIWRFNEFIRSIFILFKNNTWAFISVFHRVTHLFEPFRCSYNTFSRTINFIWMFFFNQKKFTTIFTGSLHAYKYNMAQPIKAI